MTDQFFPEHDDTRPEAGPASPRFDVSEPPHPVNWNLLTANDLEAELLELNRWVDWLRHTYGLPASVVPPYWHRHPELLWEELIGHGRIAHIPMAVALDGAPC